MSIFSSRRIRHSTQPFIFPSPGDKGSKERTFFRWKGAGSLVIAAQALLMNEDRNARRNNGSRISQQPTPAGTHREGFPIYAGVVFGTTVFCNSGRVFGTDASLNLTVELTPATEGDVSRPSTLKPPKAWRKSKCYK